MGPEGSERKTLKIGNGTIIAVKAVYLGDVKLTTPPLHLLLSLPFFK